MSLPDVDLLRDATVVLQFLGATMTMSWLAMRTYRRIRRIRRRTRT